MTASGAQPVANSARLEERVAELLSTMTLTEKIGQMSQVNAAENYVTDWLRADIQSGRIGAILNQVDVDVVNEIQRIAVEESRLGIPLLIGRDVIHGFKTVLPIPLGQAASWNPELVRAGAAVAAREAAACGINWTFAPMLDISRDPRWGRIAESLGEDPFLSSCLGAAMVRGFQGVSLDQPDTIAACGKHFAGYGAAESGRDYATTNIPENELRNNYLVPFHSAVNAGVTSLMTSFSDLDGIPASANEFLLRRILRCEWQFDGFVVSDWDSVRQLQIHGLTDNDKESAYQAVNAGVDMEMAGDSYRNYIESLVEQGRLSIDLIDMAVGNILRIKFRLGLFDNPYTDASMFPPPGDPEALALAREFALQSVVLLKNDNRVLPLQIDKINSLAVIGPLANAPYEQLGTWIFDGDESFSITGVDAIRELAGDRLNIEYHQALETSRSKSTESFDEVINVVERCDASVLFLGEESILSGEAHCRADIDLPGAQADLVARLRRTGKPLIAVVLAGRPLTLTNIVDQVDALLMAWHPGTMGGPAIADLLFGVHSPSGKLPASFPRHVGQIPIHYNQKNTGKPPSQQSIVHIDDIDAEAPQTSLGMTAFHLDTGYKPLWPFGYGLSYAHFRYSNLRCSAKEIHDGEVLEVFADLTNDGEVPADEVAQLYVRDLVGSVTRPVRELKNFKRVTVQPGETITLRFELPANALAFYGRNQELQIEPGEFHVWVGGSSEAELQSSFRLVSDS